MYYVVNDYMKLGEREKKLVESLINSISCGKKHLAKYEQQHSLIETYGYHY